MRKIAKAVLESSLCLCFVSISVFAWSTSALAPSAGSAKDAASLNNLGVAYMGQQQGEQALAQFRQAAVADKSSAIPHLNAGIVLLTLQRLDESKTELEEAAKMDPGNPRAWYNLGLLERGKGNCDASIPAFEHVLKIDPSSADAHYFLGSCFGERREQTRSAEEYRAALRVNPMHASAEFGLARALQRSGDTDQAREHLQRFEHLTHEKIGSVLASTYGDQGAYSLAEEIKANLPPAVMISISFADAALPSPATTSAPATTKMTAADSPLAGGMCLIDMEGHGHPDLLLLGDGEAAITYYHHLAGGGFEMGSAQKLGLAVTGHAVSCAIGDFDDDGLPDIALAMSDRVLLYRNTGKGGFSDVTEAAGIRQLNRPAGLTFVDYDHDGDLDLFVTGAPLDKDKRVDKDEPATTNVLWRNNGNHTFTEWTLPAGLEGTGSTITAMLSDLNNDRAVDLVVSGQEKGVTLYMNPREGRFPALPLYAKADLPPAVGIAMLDFNKDGRMDIAVTHSGAPGITLWKNVDGKRFERIPLPLSDVKRGWGITSVDIDNDGWIDLAAVVETSRGSEIRVLRNTGDGGFADVSAPLKLGSLGVGSADIGGVNIKDARSIVAFDADGDGDADLLVSTASGSPHLLRNDGGNKNHSLQIVLHGNADNKMGIGTKVEVFAGGLWQKWEIAGAGGYLGQGATSILAGLGETSQPVIVRTLWPTGVPQDEVNVAASGAAEVKELDRRGSSCPVVFAWDGEKYQFVTDTIGAAVIGHWISPHARNIPDPDEWIKVDSSQLKARNGYLSLRIGEPMEEVNFVDQVRLIAVDHPADAEVFPNERFKNDPPFADGKTIFTKEAHRLSAASDNHGKDVLTLLSARDHEFVRDFTNLPYGGFADTHTLTMDVGPWSAARPLRLIMSGFIEYFSATSLYSAWQAGIKPVSPYIEAQMPDGTWIRIVDDMGFPAGLPRTIITDLTGKMPAGATKLRITTNLQIYWDQIMVSNEAEHPEFVHTTEAPLVSGSLGFRGYPRQIDGATPGDLNYAYDEASVTGPFVRQRGPYTRYGNVTPLLTSVDNQFVIFGSGEDIDLEFRESVLPPLPAGWTRDYFFYANGYVKDMDYYEAMPFTVAAMPFHGMSSYPYAQSEHFPDSSRSLDYQLSWNDRFETGMPSSPYLFNYQPRHAIPQSLSISPHDLTSGR